MNFKQKIDILVENQKIPKIAKNSIFRKKSIFQKSFQIAQNDVIWPEMDPPSVLEAFCTRN